jgi:putative transposase
LKDELMMLRRIQLERKACPSALAFDSQSVKVTSFISLDTGIDANKRINGRKRHLAVDTLGYPIALCVTGANMSDTEAGKALADRVATKLADWTKRYETANRLALVRADAGYKTSFVDQVTQTHEWLVDIARGRPVKNQNRQKDLSHNQDVGQWKEVTDGSIFGVD